MTTNENEVVIEREFDAPRELVWKVWTEPKHVEQWWGPRGYETRVTDVDMRVGGKWNYVMIGPDGTQYPANGVFSEIVPPEKIVTTHEFGDKFDEIMPHADLPMGFVTTAIFDDLGDRTRLTLRMAHASPEDRKKHENLGVVAGWNSSFECMDEYLVELQK
jgi:uncharacterized protein YndB with AHSA1/START domain